MVYARFYDWPGVGVERRSDSAVGRGNAAEARLRPCRRATPSTAISSSGAICTATRIFPKTAASRTARCSIPCATRIDAAGLDFIGITDHTRYLPRRYNLWRIQQITDLHLQARARFRRCIPTSAASIRPGAIATSSISTATIRRCRLVTISATRASVRTASSPRCAARTPSRFRTPRPWGNKQVSWEYNDPDIERLVEIYQGCRSTYEYNGAPDPAGQAVYEKDSPNFVWNALEKKIKLGFIASSDHGSTHMSFAAVYTKGIDRAVDFRCPARPAHLCGDRQDPARFLDRRGHHGGGDRRCRHAGAECGSGRDTARSRRST